MASVYRWNIGYRDARGHIGRTEGFVFTNGHGASAAAVGLVQGLTTAINAATNAVPVFYNGLAAAVAGTAGQVVLPNQYGTNAEYPNAEDKARLQFLYTGAVMTSLSIPAPKLALFDTDGETVDPTNTLAAAILAALTTDGAGGEYFCSKGGAAIIAMPGGMRVRRRFQRKTTTWTLTPVEAGPEE